MKPKWQFQYSLGWRIVFGIAFNRMDLGNLKHRSFAIWIGPFCASMWKEAIE